MNVGPKKRGAKRFARSEIEIIKQTHHEPRREFFQIDGHLGEGRIELYNKVFIGPIGESPKGGWVAKLPGDLPRGRGCGLNQIRQYVGCLCLHSSITRNQQAGQSNR